MKKTIRLVALVLSLVMCAVLFAACDGSGSAGQASQSQQETSAPEEDVYKRQGLRRASLK